MAWCDVIGQAWGWLVTMLASGRGRTRSGWPPFHCACHHFLEYKPILWIQTCKPPNLKRFPEARDFSWPPQMLLASVTESWSQTREETKPPHNMSDYTASFWRACPCLPGAPFPAPETQAAIPPERKEALKSKGPYPNNARQPYLNANPIQGCNIITIPGFLTLATCKLFSLPTTHPNLVCLPEKKGDIKEPQQPPASSRRSTDGQDSIQAINLSSLWSLAPKSRGPKEAALIPSQECSTCAYWWEKSRERRRGEGRRWRKLKPVI